MRHSISRQVSATVAYVTLMMGVSGCTVAIVDPAASAAPTAGVQTPPAQVEPSPAASAPPAAAGASGLSPENAADRARLLSQASTVMPCPDGPLDQDGAVIRVEGQCDDLVIEMDAGVVIADDVTSLTVSGDGSAVYAETIGTVAVTGSASVVYWTGATPTVDDRGTANTIRHG